MAWWAFSNGRKGFVADVSLARVYTYGNTYGMSFTGPYKTQGGAADSLRQAGVQTIPPPGAKKPKGAKGGQGQKSGPSGAEIVAAARTWLGVPYLYGGTTRQGVDCSGLVLGVANQVDIKGCPRTSEEQWAWCEKIPETDAGAGDLVFFVGAEIDPPPGHVGIIVSRGTMINAPFTGTVVRYDHYADGPGVNKIIGYGRMRGATKSTSANPVYGSQATAQQGGAVLAESLSGVVTVIGLAFLVILLVVLLIGAGLIFGGSRR